jgi:hypothetical protein
VPNTPLLHPAIKPLRKTISIEDLIKEQNYQGFNAEKFSAVCEAFYEDGWEDDFSTDELLAMI